MVASDEQLIQLYIESGDNKVFSTLISRYERTIFHKCLGYVRNKDTAEDLYQEVLVKVYLQIKNFRSQARFSTWLFAIIHNTCIDYLRKAKKNVREIITEKLANELPDLVDDQDEVSKELSMKILDELLKQMSPEDSMLLLLKYKEKYQIKDIQKTLGISESAIKMRLKRARDKINLLYQRYN